jgi:signal transduction histidine kinase/ActR/RegA family two-component response regulator
MSPLSGLRRDWKGVAAAVGAVALILVSMATAAFNESVYRARKAQYLTAEADVLAATVEPALVFLDAAAARDAVAALNANGEVETAGVYDATGALVAQFSRNGATPPARTAEARAAPGRMAVIVPVLSEGRSIGGVYLRTTPEPAVALAARHGGTALLLLLAFLVVTVLQWVQTTLARAARETEARAAELSQLNLELGRQVQQRESAEEALRQAQKMETLGQLTGGIAHDFNNLLQNVQGSLDLISRKPDDPAKVGRWAAAGLEAAERGARLTAQLLAFSRAQKLELRPLNLADVAERLRQLLGNTMGAGVKVVFDLDPSPAPVIADATQLELALLNLCINARDAMPNGGLITVSTRPARLEADPELGTGEFLLLSVSDTGVGMPRDVRARAFDPFFTTKGLGKGTGLGLAQVYGIAKQAGGSARIHSEPGKGTSVTLILPRADQAAAAAASAPAHPFMPVVAGARILVVDDDAGVRGYVAEALANLGYAPMEAAEGVAGLAILDREDVDLLIVDYAMPGMSGAEVAAKALERRPDLRILFASGYAESDALEAAMGRPAQLLRKPFDTPTLARRVYEVMSGNDRAA